MSREELNKLIMQACERTWNEKTCKEIEQALSQEPCDKCRNNRTSFCGNCKDYDEFEPCDDAISREAVQEAFAEYVASGFAESVADFEGYTDIIMTLPSVAQKSEHFIDGVHAMGYREGYKDAQKQKSGKWLITSISHIAYCSECDYLFKDIPASMVEHFKYCPNCGAKMESEE